MPAILEPNFGLRYGWNLGENAWKSPGMDENLQKLGALIHLAVLDKDIGNPSVLTPVAGARYIVAASAAGAWAGQAGKVAVYDNAAWAFYTPASGWTAWVMDETLYYTYVAGAWTSLGTGQPYDIHVTFNGLVGASVTLARVVFPRATTFTAGLPASRAVAEIAATAAYAVSLTKNAVNIGSVNWAAAATVATFTMASTQLFVAGDILEIVASATPDVTLADLSMVIVGIR